MKVNMTGLNELESVEIGMNCFTKYKNTIYQLIRIVISI